MKNLLLIFLLAPLLSVAQVPPKSNTNAAAQVVTLVGTNIMPTAVRPIVEGWFEAGVTTQDVENVINAKGYTTTNDVLDLLAVTRTNLLEQLNVAQTNLQAAINAEAQTRAAGDLVAMTNWQAVVYSLTNGAALGATALQPPATNTLAAAAAHAATAHDVTQYGGFQGGGVASAEYGGAVGLNAHTVSGGAVGHAAYTTDGGAVGHDAHTTDGGAVGNGAQTTDGGAVGFNAKTSDGFAGGKDAFATTDGTGIGDGIDAIQLGTGGNTEPFSLQIYSNKLMHADGTIPVERLTLHNTNGLAHADIRALIPTLPDNPNIYTPVYAATTTIAINSTQAVYKATFGTAGTVTQSIAGLTVSDTQEARWELWLNATNPAALSPTWQGNLDWQGGTPELTVTGLYKFAMSTTGTRITGRQTYPTVYPTLAGAGIGAKNSGTAVSWGPFVELISSADTTAYSYINLAHDLQKPVILRAYHFLYTANDPTNPITINLGLGEPQATPISTEQTLKTNVFLTAITGNRGTPLTFYVPSVTRLFASDAWPYLRVSKPYVGGRAALYMITTKQANELETAAYNAGWRP